MLELGSTTTLVIAPHPDDEIFGCGGLIHRIKAAGGAVHVLYMTVGDTRDFSARGRSTASERMVEVDNVVDMLGIDSYALAFRGDKYHLALDAIPQRDLIDVIERSSAVSIQNLRPDLVMTTSLADYNQDHRAVAAATLAALRPGSRAHKFSPPMVLSYELPYHQWNVAPVIPSPNLHVVLEPVDLKAKLTALELYKSQLKESDSPLSVRGTEALARYRGLAVGAPAAEAYQIERLVV